jgi:hypothetical protein
MLRLPSELAAGARSIEQRHRECHVDPTRLAGLEAQRESRCGPAPKHLRRNLDTARAQDPREFGWSDRRVCGKVEGAPGVGHERAAIGVADIE